MISHYTCVTYLHINSFVWTTNICIGKSVAIQRPAHNGQYIISKLKFCALWIFTGGIPQNRLNPRVLQKTMIETYWRILGCTSHELDVTLSPVYVILELHNNRMSLKSLVASLKLPSQDRSLTAPGSNGYAFCKTVSWNRQTEFFPRRFITSTNVTRTFTRRLFHSEKGRTR